MSSETWVTYKKRVDVARKKADLAYSRVKELVDECTHDETFENEHYFGGSYLDTDYTDYWDECVVCGKSFNKRHVGHGSYG